VPLAVSRVALIPSLGSASAVSAPRRIAASIFKPRATPPTSAAQSGYAADVLLEEGLDIARQLDDRTETTRA
jgi:hypothetical protein